jgi:4-amino-4-deoxy-L-arabinose transferase-like glycosyltransferase
MLQRIRKGLLDALDHPRAPVAIIGAGLVIRLVVLVLFAGTPLDGDGRSYHDTAQSLASGVDYEPHWPPGLPLFLSIAYRVNDSMVVGRAMMLLVYLAFCALVLDLGRRLAGPRTANAALAAFAVTPIFIWSSVTPLTQLYSATLALGVVAFADRCRQRQSLSRNTALLGLCLAGLLMTRPSNAGIAALIPLYLFWRTRRWQVLVIPAVIVVLVVGAWSAKAHAMTGRFVFINDANSQNIFYGNNPWTPTYRTWWFGSRHKEDGDAVPEGYEQEIKEIAAEPMAKRDKLFVKKALDHIAARPDLFVVRTASRVRTFAAFETYTSAQMARRSKLLGAATLALDASLYVLLIGLAIFFPALRAAGPSAPERDRVGDPEIVLLLLLVAFLYALPYFVVFSHPTFHFTAVPLVSLLGAAVGVRVLDGGWKPLWAALTSRRRIAVALGYAFFFFVQIEWAVDVLSRPTR